MSPIRAVLCAALVLTTAACQEAEFPKSEPNAVVISLSSGVISADDGSITVSVSAVEEGVPLLEEPITAAIGGACAAAPQTVATGVTGLAIFTFTGLDSAGACTITATARTASDTVNFTVVPGEPAALALTTLDQLTIDAGETINYSTLVEDAAGNDIAIGVEVNTDAPDSYFDGAAITFERAGSYTIYAQLYTLTATLAVVVEPATASSVVTSLLQSSVGQQQTLDLTCAQFDAFGNPTGFAFDAADVTTNPAATTIVEDGTTENLFHISGFTTFGIFSATCDDGALSDDETFNVGQQAGANSTIATANLAQIEAGTGTLTVTCQEVDGFGNDTGFDFQAGTSFTTTASANITENSPNTFTIDTVAATGSFSATCDTGTDADSENFQVLDSTAPAISSFTFSGTAPFAAGSTVTVNFDVVDVIGVAFESIAIVSGPGEVVGSPVNFESGIADPPSRTFQVRVNGSVGVSTTVVVRGQVADTTGNLRSTSSDLSITVDPAGTVVTATLEGTTNLEAGGSIVVACDERHALTGSSAGTVFNAGTDIILGTSGHIITTLGGNRFSLSGYTVKRSETVTCDGVSDTDLATFNVVDTTPPTASTAVNPVSANYAAGTSVDVTVTASDTVGLSNASLVVASGNATITSTSVRALGGATASAPVFTVRLDGSTTSASTVMLVAQVADTTGNIREPATISLNVDQAATAVVTTLAGTAVEHNQTLDFTCKQVNAATGADTGATFALGETSTTAAGGVISSLGSNAFRITGPFTAKGSATATCTKNAQSDIETFTIYDTTAPTVGTLSVFAATGPNGVTGDNRYAPGTVLTVRLDSATDGIGLSRIDLSATGADVASSTKFVSGTAASNVDFTVHIPENAPTFGTAAITAQASDTTGNTSAVTATLTLTVDPGVGLTVATGVTLRTLFEGTTASGVPSGLGTNGTDLFLQRNNGGNIADVARLTGSTAPATLSVVIGSGFPAAHSGTGGVTAGAFGTGTIFHSLLGGSPQIGTESGTTHSRFDTGTAPVIPKDLALGDLGAGTRLFTMDDNAGTGRILKSITTGATVVYSDAGEASLNNCQSLTRDAANARLLVACTSGQIRTITDTGADAGNLSALLTTIAPNDALDIASTASDTLIAGGGSGTVYRVGDTPISDELVFPAGLAIKTADSNSLHILDVDAGGGVWRVYRVTGY